MLESALGQKRAALGRAGARQAVQHARRRSVEFARARRKGRELDVLRAGDHPARNLGCAAHVDELGRSGTVEQRTQAGGIERINHRGGTVHGPISD